MKVLDWQSLIVLANNHNEEVRVSILRLMHAYLERAPNSLKHSLIKNRGFLLLANQLYQFKTTSRLIEAALILVSGRAEPLMDFSNVGISIKDIDSTVLPAVAPLLSLIENSLQDDLLCDDLCLSIKGTRLKFNRLWLPGRVRILNCTKELFESHSEIGDTMLDRGLSIVLTNSIARQTEVSKPVSQGLLSLLHAIVDKCCTTNTEHFAVVQDIIDAISHQEMKLHDMDDDNSGESYDPSGGSEILERCDDCYKIRHGFKIMICSMGH